MDSTDKHRAVMGLLAAVVAALLVCGVATSPARAGTLGNVGVTLSGRITVGHPKELAYACLIAAATSATLSTDPKKLAEWCAIAAHHLYSLYPIDNKPPPKEP